MIEPTTKDIGKLVWWRDPHDMMRQEKGVITSFNERFVFVRYGDGDTSAATDRLDLYWPNADGL